MRPLEVLLSLANLMTFFILVVPGIRGLRGMRYAVVVTLLIVLTQVLAEGPRWQMVPAYALSGFFLLAAMLQSRQPTRQTRQSPGRPGLWWLSSALAVGLGALAWVFTAALPMLIPVFHFPLPSGPYAIGTLIYHWVDTERSEIFSTDPTARRELMVQIWYPAKRVPSLPRAPYLADADAVMAAFARIQHTPAFVFGHLKYVTTNAILSAPVADDQAGYPVLLFLEGATGFRQMNTFQVEELVSHGYIVAAIDQPGAAANVVFPDGHQVAGLTLTQFHDTVGPSYLPDQRPPTLNGRALKDNSIIPYLAQDAGFTLDQLAALNRADPNGVLTGRLDMQRAGAFGISLGGIVVGEACRLDTRLRACMVMDAPMSADVVKTGLRQPGMWITRDAASMRLERQRAGGWPEAEIDAHQSTMRAVYQSLEGAGYFVSVPGMFHSNFTDIPLWSPLASRFDFTGPIDGQRGHRIVNACSLAFFDRHLKGRRADLLDGTVNEYPEVRIETRGL